MAVINKTGITNGGTIEVGHVTRSIDALSGVGTDTIIATGSFSGSLTGVLIGTGSYATQALSSSFATTATTSTTATSASFATTATSASFAISGSRAVSASFATTASYALNAAGGGGSEYATLTFTHAEVNGTSTGQDYYFGGVPATPLNASSRTGLFIPFNCTIVSASWAMNASSPDASSGIRYYLYVKDTNQGAISPEVSLGFFRTGSSTPINLTFDKGDTVAIRAGGTADGNAVWSSNVVLILKKT